jgi:hypothetical protein
MRYESLVGAVTFASLIASSAWADPLTATLYKDPSCGCCDGYAGELTTHGIKVSVVETMEMDGIKVQRRVPDELLSCHTMIINGYAVEGHVPVGILDKLLAEKPAVEGIALAGMPLGSPGMGGEKEEPFQVMSWKGTAIQPFATD